MLLIALVIFIGVKGDGTPGVNWKFSMCTATRTGSYSLVGPSVCVFSLGLYLMYSSVFL